MVARRFRCEVTPSLSQPQLVKCHLTSNMKEDSLPLNTKINFKANHNLGQQSKSRRNPARILRPKILDLGKARKNRTWGTPIMVGENTNWVKMSPTHVTENSRIWRPQCEPLMIEKLRVFIRRTIGAISLINLDRLSLPQKINSFSCQVTSELKTRWQKTQKRSNN